MNFALDEANEVDCDVPPKKKRFFSLFCESKQVLIDILRT